MPSLIEGQASRSLYSSAVNTPLHSAQSSPRSSQGSAGSALPAETIIDILQGPAALSSTATSASEDTEDEEFNHAKLLETHFSSRTSSRPPSPLPFGSASAHAGSALATHTHIHHHYHLSTRKASSSNLAAKDRGDSSSDSVPDYFATENYRSSNLAKKLGFSQQSSRRYQNNASWFSTRKSRRRDSNREAPPSYSLATDASPPALHTTYLESSASPFWQSTWFKRNLARLLRQPFIPTQPLSVLFTLVLLTSFLFSTTTFVVHVLNNDKAPLPWRTFCAEQAAFPHELADSLDPVNVFVGIFSVDAAYERRHLIRSTYLRHSRPIDSKTGQGAHNVQVKFILGRPRSHHARRVALEMETYNDLIVLDIQENMNKGKTYAYFKWASENATIPVFYHQPGRHALHVGFQNADYVVKADDDAFIVLSELERHLRVAPRTQTYWGYLVRDLFMAGEAYALSSDLVRYVASYNPLANFVNGAEDKKVARWMRMHPNASSINWVTERCWIYDHPKSGTTYSHGFLFPDYVERIKIEAKRGLPTEERVRRGGDWSESYSTVSEWQKQYNPPADHLTIEEEVEALVEGGGRWGPEDAWRAAPVPKERYIDYYKMRFTAADQRLHRDTRSTLAGTQTPLENLHDGRELSDLRSSRFANDLLRDVEEPLFPSQDTIHDAPDSTHAPRRALPRQRHAQMPALALQEYEHLVPPPTLRFDAAQLSLRSRRMLNLANGGTVIVHFLKRNEWFLEAALILLGRHNYWDSGLTPAAYTHPPSANDLPVAEPTEQTRWDGRQIVEAVDTDYGAPRMFGSPLIRSNGYISEGRESAFERLAQLPVADDGSAGKLRGKPKLGYADPGESTSGTRRQTSLSLTLAPTSSEAESAARQRHASSNSNAPTSSHSADAGPELTHA